MGMRLLRQIMEALEPVIVVIGVILFGFCLLLTWAGLVAGGTPRTRKGWAEVGDLLVTALISLVGFALSLWSLLKLVGWR